MGVGSLPSALAVKLGGKHLYRLRHHTSLPAWLERVPKMMWESRKDLEP